jgi:uncharacterized iron-regulated protein
MTVIRSAAIGFTLAVALIGLQNACSVQRPANDPDRGGEQPVVEPRVVSEQRDMKMDELTGALLEKRVVFVGERHDRYDHHLNQLGIIRRLHEVDPDLAIGLEMFQQPYQSALDDFLAGRIDERELLETSEYFERWGYDYRLYRPILEYARLHGIPVIALNVPKELTRRVAQVGLAGLSERERRWAPGSVDKSDIAYRERLEKVFEAHGGMASSATFERFYEAQLLWDEGMAEQAARFLKSYPDKRLVVLAGGGHLAHGSGVPQRVQRRVPVPSVIVMQSDEGTPAEWGADYLLISSNVPLPPAGRLGLMLERTDAGMKVQSVVPDGSAQQAGIVADDRIVGIGGQSIRSMPDVRLALLDKGPGDSVRVTVDRARPNGPSEQLALNVMLQQ